MKKLFTLFLLLTATAWAQLSGTYTVGSGGDYDSLGAAIAALNSSGVNGAVTMLLLNGTHNVGKNISLGCTGTSATNTITFKPDVGATVTINFLDGTTSQNIDGHFVIGSPTYTNANLVSTNYITIDGSNNGTSSKDLTINGPVTSSQRSVFRIYGDNNNITIKNSIIVDRSTSASPTAPIMCTNYNNTFMEFTPDSITIDNNTLTANSGNGATGFQYTNSGTVDTGGTKIYVKNNIVTARATRAIQFITVSDGEISGNTISHDCQLGTGAAASIFLTTGTSAAGTFNIYNNKIILAKTWNNTPAGPQPSNGIIGIDNQYATPKVVNIYNNFIAGFTIATTTVQGVKIYGIRQSGSSTTNVYHNTIYIPEMTNMTTVSGSFIAGIAFASAAATEASPAAAAVMTAKNNIIYSAETTMKVYGIRRAGSTGTVTSDFNNFYFASADSGFVGFYNGSDYKTLTNWIDNTTYDDSSKNVNVSFTSTTDLHLTSGSVGDFNLRGTPLSSPYNVDIDNDSRNATYPYVGADEASTPLPVELTSFTAVTRGKNVELRWATATEVNNYGFEVQRSVVSSQSSEKNWSKVGFVEGNGTTNAPKSYSFVDAVTANGTYVYRLKQIDRDGQFEYSGEVIAQVSQITPQKFTLMQNYPNPFNPTTSIGFALQVSGYTTLKIYDALGKEVAMLVNEMKEAGEHSVQFDASSLPSGMYFYTLRSGSKVETKKMLLVK